MHCRVLSSMDLTPLNAGPPDMAAPRRDNAELGTRRVGKSRYGRNFYYSAFAQYESRKAAIVEAGLSPATYTQLINRLAAMLGV